MFAGVTFCWINVKDYQPTYFQILCPLTRAEYITTDAFKTNFLNLKHNIKLTNDLRLNKYAFVIENGKIEMYRNLT